jgi:Glyoxalase-like domain
MIDHLVYATPDVDLTVADLAERLGVRAAAGGRHPGRGTRNALIGLGPRCYLEIVGPDAEQPVPAKPRWFLIDELREARLVAWAAAAELDESRAGVLCGSRQRPDGQLLSWRFTGPVAGVMPFFIDWGKGPHPADLLPREVRLLELRLEHPEPAAFGKLGFTVHAGPRARLAATLETPRGLQTL